MGEDAKILGQLIPVYCFPISQLIKFWRPADVKNPAGGAPAGDLAGSRSARGGLAVPFYLYEYQSVLLLGELEISRVRNSISKT